MLIEEAKSIQGIVEDNKKPYSDIKILVQGVTADNPLNVRDINGTKAVIDKVTGYASYNPCACPATTPAPTTAA